MNFTFWSAREIHPDPRFFTKGPLPRAPRISYREGGAQRRATPLVRTSSVLLGAARCVEFIFTRVQWILNRMRGNTPTEERPLRIGIVDDDEDVRRAVRRLLLASGFEVSVYSSGEAFLAARDTPDCLLLDVQLGGMTGIELYRQLQASHDAPPVVFITAHFEMLHEIERMGTPCLPKPFDEQALVEAIARARRPA